MTERKHTEKNGERLFDPINTAHIPQEMRDVRQWLCWRYVYEDDRDKPRKVPINAITGRMCDPTDEKNWQTFVLAVNYAGSRPDSVGIGFALKPPFVGVDLDNCIDDQGAVTPEAQRVWGHLQDTYAETSPSGKGIHIYCKGEIGRSRKARYGEIYSEKRYFTVTGARLADTPDTLATFDKDVFAQVEKAIGAAEADAQVVSTHMDEIDTDDTSDLSYLLFEALMGSHPQCKATWDKKRDSDFPSDSEYEMALSRFAAVAGWSAQDIWRLLKTWRIKHQLPEKHVGALLQTIGKALSATDEDSHVESVLDAPERFSEADQKGTLRQLFRFDTARFVQLGKNPASYQLYLASGDVIMFPSTREVRKQEYWADALLENTGIVWRQMKMPKWEKALELYLRVHRECEENPHTSEKEETREWVREHVQNAQIGMPTAVRVMRGDPFRYQGMACLNLMQFMRFVRVTLRHPIDRRALAGRLRALGMEQRKIEAPSDNGVASVSKVYWVASEHVVIF